MIKKYKRHDWSQLLEIFVYYPFDSLKDFAEALGLNYNSSQFWLNCKHWICDKNTLRVNALLNCDIEIIDMMMHPENNVSAGEYQELLSKYLSLNKDKPSESLYNRALSFYPSFKKCSRIKSTIAYIKANKPNIT